MLLFSSDLMQSMQSEFVCIDLFSLILIHLLSYYTFLRQGFSSPDAFASYTSSHSMSSSISSSSLPSCAASSLPLNPLAEKEVDLSSPIVSSPSSSVAMLSDGLYFLSADY